MKIDLIAKLKSYDEFINEYIDGDEKKVYNGRSLIFYSLSNTNLDARYRISKFLCDKNVDVLSKNEENQTVLHVLLGQAQNEISETRSLCSFFIDKGVNINDRDSNGQVALEYIIRMKYTDEQLNPLYDLWFSQPDLDLFIKDNTDCTPVEYAKKFPYRSDLLKRMDEYEQEKNN